MGLFEIIRLGSILSVIRYTAHRGYAYRGRAPRTEGGTGEAPYVSGPGGVPGTGCSPVIPKSVQFTNPELVDGKANDFKEPSRIGSRPEVQHNIPV